MKTEEMLSPIYNNSYRDSSYRALSYMIINHKTGKLEKFSIKMPIVNGIALYNNELAVFDARKIGFYNGEPFVEICSIPYKVKDYFAGDKHNRFSFLDFDVVSDTRCYGRFGMMMNPDRFFSIKDLTLYAMAFGE